MNGQLDITSTGTARHFVENDSTSGAFSEWTMEHFRNKSKFR